ncbi:MAG: Dyp-type peroxidase [Sulfitobacter sp.]
MQNEFFSNHIGSASELTVLANIKPGFVPIPEPITYAARLRLHLRMLSALRRGGLESDRAGVYVGPVDNLRTLQYVRWTLIDDDTRMLLSVNFDRPLEPYIRRIVDQAGPLLDTILCHCEGFIGHASDQGYEGFLDWATRHQVPVELFAAAAPDVTVDDADYFLKTHRAMHNGEVPEKPVAADPAAAGDGTFSEQPAPGAEDATPQSDFRAWLASQRFDSPEERLAAASKASFLALLDQSINIVRVMYDNNHRFPKKDFRGDLSRDDLLYYNLTESLVGSLWPGLRHFAKKLEVDVDTAQPDWQTRLLDQLVERLEAMRGAGGAGRVASRALDLLTHNNAPLRWFAQLLSRDDVKSPRPEVPPVDMVQAGLVDTSPVKGQIETPKGQRTCTHADMILFRVDDAKLGRDFLRDLWERLWPDTVEGDFIYTLSITYNGFKALELPDPMLRNLPEAFREGMAARAGLLGDIGCNYPTEWTWPEDPTGVSVPPEAVDLILNVQLCPQDGVVADKERLDKEIQDLLKEAAANGVHPVAIESMYRRFKDGEVIGHLGLVDGISQPDFIVPSAEARNPKNQSWQQPFLGEFLLGHPKRLDRTADPAVVPSYMYNGTFQVLRKISVDVNRFEKDAHSAHPEMPPEVVKSKLLGRNTDGTQLFGETKNNFDYSNGDKMGDHVPLQSHIRRANPRESDTPRILRRGFSYGDPVKEGAPDEADRGLIFIAYNASIAEQFEVIQRWLNGGNSTGLSSWQGDPLLAPKRPDGCRAFNYAVADKETRVGVRVELDEKPVGILQWGLYAFVPSRSGLERILNVGEWVNEQPAITAPPELSDAAQWKLFLEDTDEENRPRREAFWAEVRKKGAKRAPGYGVLVGSEDAVMDVLRNKDGAFSTQEYHARMTKTVGVQYLGLDGGEGRQTEKDLLENFLANVQEEDIFNRAFTRAKEAIEALPEERQSLLKDGQDNETHDKLLGRRFDAQNFMYEIVGHLCRDWFDLPNTHPDFIIGGPQTEGPNCPRDFVASSFYVFGPRPTEAVTKNAHLRSARAVKLIETALAAEEAPGGGALRLHLNDAAKANPEYWSIRKQAEYIAGCCLGFAGPVSGSFRSAMFDWIKTDALWRVHQQYRSALQSGKTEFEAATIVLRPAVIRGIGERLVPDLLYRRAIKDTTLGDAKVEPGDLVVFSLRSAIAGGGDPETILFGGKIETPEDVAHPCAGRQMALITMIACAAALFNYRELRPTGPLNLLIR